MYELECPNCHTFNQVDSEAPIVEWVCIECESQPVTSLPTDEEGNLL